jgi:hypothetical protein
VPIYASMLSRAVRRDRHTLLRLAAAVLCVVFIVIVLVKGLWILALFGAVVLSMQLINLALGPRTPRTRRSRRVARPGPLDPPSAERAPVPDSRGGRSAPPRASEAARQRARRGRGRT